MHRFEEADRFETFWYHGGEAKAHGTREASQTAADVEVGEHSDLRGSLLCHQLWVAKIKVNTMYNYNNYYYHSPK